MYLCEWNPQITSGFSSHNKVMCNFSLIFSWRSCWTNNRVVGDLRHHDAHVTSVIGFSVWCFSLRYLGSIFRGGHSEEPDLEWVFDEVGEAAALEELNDGMYVSITVTSRKRRGVTGHSTVLRASKKDKYKAMHHWPLLPEGKKSLPEPMLVNHQSGIVTFTWEQLHSGCQSFLCIINLKLYF